MSINGLKIVAVSFNIGVGNQLKKGNIQDT